MASGLNPSRIYFKNKTNMVVPALLTDKKEDLISMLNACSEFTNHVQVDIMDGEFVPSKSISILDLEGLQCPLRSEAHLMVSDPFSWIEPFKRFGTERIIYHFEIKEDHLKIINAIKNKGLKTGIAINPSTKIDDFRPLVKEIDMFLFMSVNPGFYGAEFMPQVLEKIRSFKDEFPHKLVGIDGGIKFDNLLSAKYAGVDYVCVGSAILKADSPKEAYLKFSGLINE